MRVRQLSHNGETTEAPHLFQTRRQWEKTGNFYHNSNNRHKYSYVLLYKLEAVMATQNDLNGVVTCDSVHGSTPLPLNPGPVLIRPEICVEYSNPIHILKSPCTIYDWKCRDSHPRLPMFLWQNTHNLEPSLKPCPCLTRGVIDLCRNLGPP